MTKDVGVRVEGGRAIRAGLKRAAGNLDDLKAPHLEVAQLVADKADTPERSGALDGTVRAAGTGTAAIVRAGRASVPYAGPVYGGWPARNIKPQPFIADAAYAYEAQIMDIYADGVQRVLDRIKGYEGP